MLWEIPDPMVKILGKHLKDTIPTQDLENTIGQILPLFKDLYWKKTYISIIKDVPSMLSPEYWMIKLLIVS